MDRTREDGERPMTGITTCDRGHDHRRKWAIADRSGEYLVEDAASHASGVFSSRRFRARSGTYGGCSGHEPYVDRVKACFIGDVDWRDCVTIWCRSGQARTAPLFTPDELDPMPRL